MDRQVRKIISHRLPTLEELEAGCGDWLDCCAAYVHKPDCATLTDERLWINPVARMVAHHKAGSAFHLYARVTDDARVGEIRERRAKAAALEARRGYNHPLERPTWADVDYLLSLLPQLASSSADRICECGHLRSNHRTAHGTGCNRCLCSAFTETASLSLEGEEKQRDIWDALNQRRAELIDTARSRRLTGEEAADLIALQRVAGLVRELVADQPFEVNDNPKQAIET